MGRHADLFWCVAAVAWDSVALGVRGSMVGVAGLFSSCSWGSGAIFLLGWVRGRFSGHSLGAFGLQAPCSAQWGVASSLQLWLRCAWILW